MNNKGFTLIELIIVIALLGALSVVVGLNVNNTLNKQKDKEKNEYREKIEKAACVYADTKIDIKTCSPNCIIKVNTLINEGLIDKNIKNQFNKDKSNPNTVLNDPSEVKVYLNNNEKICEYIDKN